MSRPALIVLAILSFMPGRARAEQPIPPTCKCNDDCVSKWPYSGICVQYSWGKVCGYSGSGPGVPCTDGGPAPDLKKDVWFGCGDAMPNCSCDDDCKPHGLAFCVKHPSSLCAPICSNKGPGIACAKKDVGPEGPSHRPCRCNAECASVAGMPYCAYQSGAWFCSSVGPGTSCPDDVPPRTDDVPRPGDDWYPRDSGPGGSAAPPPRGGCSVGMAPGATGPSSLLALLLGLALLLARRRRS